MLNYLSVFYRVFLGFSDDFFFFETFFSTGFSRVVSGVFYGFLVFHGFSLVFLEFSDDVWKLCGFPRVVSRALRQRWKMLLHFVG